MDDAETLVRWEGAKETMTMREFAASLGRTRKSVDNAIYRARKAPVEYGADGPRILIFDIEIAPALAYVWGAYQQFVQPEAIKEDYFVICWAAKWLGSDDVLSATVTPDEARACDDGRVVGIMWDLLETADIVVAHNAKKFDVKKVNWRLRLNSYPPPLPYRVVDTLAEVRKHFGATSNKLDYINKQLGRTRKLKTSFDLWVRCKHGEQQALDDMIAYNVIDIVALEETYLDIRPWMTNHPNHALYSDSDVSVCSACGSSEIEYLSKRVTTSANAYRAYRCKCGNVGRNKIAITTKEQRKALLT